MSVDVEVEVIIDRPGGGTRMTLRNKGTPAGFAQLTAPMVERAMRRATTKHLTRLKHLLETGHGG